MNFTNVNEICNELWRFLFFYHKFFVTLELVLYLFFHSNCCWQLVLRFLHWNDFVLCLYYNKKLRSYKRLLRPFLSFISFNFLHGTYIISLLIVTYMVCLNELFSFEIKIKLQKLLLLSFFVPLHGIKPLNIVLPKKKEKTSLLINCVFVLGVCMLTHSLTYINK